MREYGYQLVGSNGGNKNSELLPAPIIRLADHSTVNQSVLFYFQLLIDGAEDSPSQYSAMIRGIDSACVHVFFTHTYHRDLYLSRIAIGLVLSTFLTLGISIVEFYVVPSPFLFI